MYSQLIGSNHPGLFIVLIDQSESMADSYAGTNKAIFAARAVNRTIYEILDNCMAGEKMKDRCHITVIGYGKTTEMILGGLPSEIKEPPHGKEILKKRISDGAGGLVEVDDTLGVWVRPTHGNGTPMAKAFEMAAALVQAWTRDNPDNFPPVVFNITDGVPDDADAAKQAAQRLAGFDTSDGKVLIFNCHLGNGTMKSELPASGASLTEPGAQLLFEMSSVLPEQLFKVAQNAGLAPQEGSRAFGMNAEPEFFIKLLAFGSVVGAGR